LPEVHETVLGRPVTDGLAENTHFDALGTDPTSLTVPPVEVKTVDVAIKNAVGVGGPAILTMLGWP
jgi:hypothetical protein